MEFWRFLGALPRHYLLQIGGHRHVHVDVEPFELILAPGNEASVLRLDDIFGSKELAFKICLGIDNFKILKKRHGSSFRDQRLGTYTHSRRSKHQYLTLSGLGFRHDKCAEQIHSGIGRRELHFGDCKVDRSGIYALRYFQRESNIFDIAVEQSGHAGFAIEIFLIISVDRQLFGQAFNLVVCFGLELVGIRNSAVSNKIVNSPVREKLLHHFSAWHLIVGSSPCLDNTFKNLILRIDGDIIKCDCQFPCEHQRLPYHMAVAFEMSRFIVDGFELPVKHEFILTDTYTFPFQVCYACGCRLFIGNLYLICALEISVCENLRHCEVHNIDAVVEESNGFVVNRRGLDTKQQVIALCHFPFELVPADRVGLCLKCPMGIDRRTLENLCPGNIILCSKQFHIIHEFYRIRLCSGTSFKRRSVPFDSNV